MDSRPKLSIKREHASFGHAFSGLLAMLRHEPHARFHLLASLGVLLLGALLRVTPTHWCILLLCIALVWTAEAVNTAIEALADALHPDHHPLVGRAKDVAAGAVLAASIAAAIIGLIILLPPALDLITI